MATTFFWYELMTSDLDAAAKFYPAVIGWTAEDFPGSEMRYIVMNAKDGGVGGIMTLPEAAKAMGAGPAWIGYIKAGNVDADTDAVKAAGGAVYQPPRDIPNVGRFAVMLDDQGAVSAPFRAATGDADGGMPKPGEFY